MSDVGKADAGGEKLGTGKADAGTLLNATAETGGAIGKGVDEDKAFEKPSDDSAGFRAILIGLKGVGNGEGLGIVGNCIGCLPTPSIAMDDVGKMRAETGMVSSGSISSMLVSGESNRSMMIGS